MYHKISEPLVVLGSAMIEAYAVSPDDAMQVLKTLSPEQFDIAKNLAGKFKGKKPDQIIKELSKNPQVLQLLRGTRDANTVTAAGAASVIKNILIGIAMLGVLSGASAGPRKEYQSLSQFKTDASALLDSAKTDPEPKAEVQEALRLIPSNVDLQKAIQESGAYTTDPTPGVKKTGPDTIDVSKWTKSKSA